MDSDANEPTEPSDAIEVIEIAPPSGWRIEIRGNLVHGGKWVLYSKTNEVATTGSLPPYAFWPSPRYAATYALVEAVKQLYRIELDRYAQEKGYRDIVGLIEAKGRRASLKGYAYTYITPSGEFQDIKALFQQILELLGLCNYIKIREVDDNRFSVETTVVPEPIDTWFLRGLAITDGLLSNHGFSSPRSELLGAVLAQCSGRVLLGDLKVWNGKLKITLRTKISSKPFRWVRNALEDLPRIASEGLELLAGMLFGDGFVNRLTKSTIIAVSLRSRKGMTILEILRHLENLGLVRLKADMERVENKRELRIYIPRDIHVKLAIMIPYYKGYRMAIRCRSATRKDIEKHHVATNVDLSEDSTYSTILKVIERYIQFIKYAKIDHDKSCSKLRIVCAERSSCERLMEELKRIGLRPVTLPKYRKAFRIAKYKEVVAYILDCYGKLKLDAETQHIYVEWLHKLNHINH